jgi:hypothetical protein
LRFEIEPAVKARKGARPLPLEGRDQAAQVRARHYDLFEWFAFPDKGGAWTVRAVFESKGAKLISAPVAITIRTPDKSDAEYLPMARIHHTPWSNYDTNAFCGDTFDVVKQWPRSRFAKYCHYWNGRYSQNRKEYDKAIASYRLVVEQYPDFALAGAAELGMVECLHALKKVREARERLASLRQKLERARKTGFKGGADHTVVEQLAVALDDRLKRAPSQE